MPGHPRLEAIQLDDQLLSPAYVENPYATYDLLRTHAPVYWSARWSAWIVTRYDDVVGILRDHRHFSNRGRYTSYIGQLPPDQQRQLAALLEHYEHGGLVQLDPPAHTRLRRLVNLAFTPRAVAQMRALVEQLVDRLLDEAAPRGRLELIYEFAFPLPAIVIAGMLGVPAAERDQFKDWSSKIQRFLGSGAAHFPYGLEAQESWLRMNAYFQALLDERKRHPQDDLINGLAAAREDGDTLSEDELVRTCGAMLIAGHETTTNLISSGVLALLAQPDQLQAVREDPALYPGAVEEFLRYDSPFQSAPRTVVEDVELHGRRLRRNDLVYVMLGAANRDPRQFANPDQLDIRRNAGKQVAFGHGVHHCLGAALARLEAPIALQRLFDRFPTLRLVSEDPPRWKRSMVQRGLERMVVTW
ncbi:MAG TPA: cytochrome P450 [Chloroflexota bacterium]|nr:cytochrome P450 [Chloroflexota bacterium]